MSDMAKSVGKLVKSCTKSAGEASRQHTRKIQATPDLLAIVEAVYLAAKHGSALKRKVFLATLKSLRDVLRKGIKLGDSKGSTALGLKMLKPDLQKALRKLPIEAKDKILCLLKLLDGSSPTYPFFLSLCSMLADMRCL